MEFLKAIWGSFNALPLWVKLWMILILVPINLATILFTGQAFGKIIASLAVLGMGFNIIPLIAERGFGKAMAIPHVILWVPLVIIILLKALPIATGGYLIFLITLLIINIISLLFDIPDSIKWLKGDRAVPK